MKHNYVYTKQFSDKEMIEYTESNSDAISELAHEPFIPEAARKQLSSGKSYYIFNPATKEIYNSEGGWSLKPDKVQIFPSEDSAKEVADKLVFKTKIIECSNTKQFSKDIDYNKIFTEFTDKDWNIVLGSLSAYKEMIRSIPQSLKDDLDTIAYVIKTEILA